MRICKIIRRGSYLWIWLLLFIGKTALASAPAPGVSVYFIGTDAAIRDRVFLDPTIRPAASLRAAEVIVIHNTTPPETEVPELITAVHEGQGLVILMGPEVGEGFLTRLYEWPGPWTWFRESPLTVKFYLPTPGFWRELWNRRRGTPTAVQPHWSQTGKLDWSTFPEVYDRVAIPRAPSLGKALVLDDRSEEGILYEGRIGQGRVYLFTPWLQVDPQASLSRQENKNYQLVVWPFFNYLLHGLILEAAGQVPPRFRDWALSPLPRPATRRACGWFIALFFLLTLAVFLAVLTYSRKHRGPLEDFAQAVWTHDTFDLAGSRQENHWQDAGFYRPLSGFVIKLVIFVPFLALVVPLGIWTANNLLIFPQAKGMDALVLGAMGVIFFFFDLGLDSAAIKFYSEHRIKDPRRAVKYFQLLIWWQILTGQFQVILIALAVFFPLSHSIWAYLTIAFLGNMVKQWLEFYGYFFNTVFQSFQRFDYAQYLQYLNNVAYTLLLIPIYIGLRKWGLAHPQYGEMLACFLGLGLLLLVSPLPGFFFGLFLYRRLGYPLKVMFMAHFDWSVLKDAVGYGYKLTLRQLINRLDQFLSLALFAVVLFNYLEVTGLVTTALGVLAFFSILDVIHQSIFPSFAEAYTQERMHLARHYLIQALGWGMIGTIICVAPALVWIPLGGPVLSPQWQRAIPIVPVLILNSALAYFANMPDSVFKAAGKTHFVALMGAILLGFKLILGLVLVPRYQMFGLAWTLTLVNLADALLSWSLVHRYVLPLRFNIFRLIFPSLLAGIVLVGFYFGLRALLLPLGTPGVAVFTLLFLPLGPLAGLLIAMFGGTTELSLQELKRAIAVNSVLEKVSRPTLLLVEWGRHHRIFPEYQPEDPAAVQADSDYIVAARMSEDSRASALETLSTLQASPKTPAG